MGLRVEVTSLEHLSESQIKELVIIQVSQCQYDSFNTMFLHKHLHKHCIHIIFYINISIQKNGGNSVTAQ